MIMYNVQIKHFVSGKEVPLHPITKDKNVNVTVKNDNVPEDVKTVGDVISKLGSLAFTSDSTNFVHTTGDEEISGHKTFKDPITIDEVFHINTTEDEAGEVTVHFRVDETIIPTEPEESEDE